MKIKSIKSLGIQDVWNLTVDDPEHNYILSNGLVSKNSHSIAYSFITYTTAYLKANYPVQFFTALMSRKSQELSPKVWQEKVIEYTDEAKIFGIEIAAPDVNHSDVAFYAKDKTIFFGLAGIKTVAKGSAEHIIRAREKGPFKDVFDFLDRVNRSKLNTGKFQALVYAGCFDKMGYKRDDLIEKTKELYDYYEDIKEYELRITEHKEREEKRNIILLERKEGKVGEKLPTALKLKEAPIKPIVERYTKIKIHYSELLKQAEYIGCYLGAHPTKMIPGNFTDINKLWIGDQFEIKCLIQSVKKIVTKKKDAMAFVSLEDASGKCEGVIFPRQWSKCQEGIKSGILARAIVKVESENPIKVIIEKIELIGLDL